MGDNLLTAKDVARRWRVHESYVYALARSHDLASITLGRRRGVRFDPADVRAYEEQRRVAVS